MPIQFLTIILASPNLNDTKFDNKHGLKEILPIQRFDIQFNTPRRAGVKLRLLLPSARTQPVTPCRSIHARTVGHLTERFHIDVHVCLCRFMRSWSSCKSVGRSSCLGLQPLGLIRARTSLVCISAPLKGRDWWELFALLSIHENICFDVDIGIVYFVVGD